MEQQGNLVKKSTKIKSKKPKNGPKSLNRRNRVKYPALNPSYNLKTRTDEITDVIEYAKNIPDDYRDPATGVLVKEFLNSFVEETINANFAHKGPKLLKNVEQKRERYRANNSRNKDIYTREKAQGKLNYIEDIKDKYTSEVADEFDLEMSVDENKDFYFWTDSNDEN